MTRPTRTLKARGREQQMGRTNMHKVHVHHNVAFFIQPPSHDLTWTYFLWCPHTAWPDLPERTDEGENGKWIAQTCISHTSGHNLAFLIWPPSHDVEQQNCSFSDILFHHFFLPFHKSITPINDKWHILSQRMHLNGYYFIFWFFLLFKWIFVTQLQNVCYSAANCCFRSYFDGLKSFEEKMKEWITWASLEWSTHGSHPIHMFEIT